MSAFRTEGSIFNCAIRRRQDIGWAGSEGIAAHSTRGLRLPKIALCLQ